MTWSYENRSQLIRIPAVKSGHRRIELRSADPMANPYLAFALLIYAGLDGIDKNMTVPKPLNINLYKAGSDVTKNLVCLPKNIEAAYEAAAKSEFIRAIVPESYMCSYKR